MAVFAHALGCQLELRLLLDLCLCGGGGALSRRQRTPDLAGRHAALGAEFGARAVGCGGRQGIATDLAPSFVPAIQLLLACFLRACGSRQHGGRERQREWDIQLFMESCRGFTRC
jgi:hypothetical protein